MSLIERYWLVGFEDSVPRAFHSEHDARMYAGVHDGQELGEYVPARQLRGAVSREHAVQAIGWLSAEVAVHGAPSLGPEWLELWERALTATGSSTGAIDERDRLREVLRAVLMEPDPIKRNQLAAPVLTNLGGR
jgi:hypothetical protein